MMLCSGWTTFEIWTREGNLRYLRSSKAARDGLDSWLDVPAPKRTPGGSMYNDLMAVGWWKTAKGSVYKRHGMGRYDVASGPIGASTKGDGK